MSEQFLLILSPVAIIATAVALKGPVASRMTQDPAITAAAM